VVWVFVHAPSESTELEASDLEFLTIRPNVGTLRWIRTTPDLEAWFNSPDFMTAPEQWPSDVAKIMKEAGDPSPFEVANAKFAWRSLSDGGRMLIAFACGVPVATMAAVLGCSRGHVERAMVGAAAQLVARPEFAVWALNVDLSRACHAMIMPGTLADRIDAHADLIADPMCADPYSVAFLVASPLFMAGARSGSLPKRVGYRQMREPVHVRPPRYHGEE
jgi:hypothetical protein